jgi:hypothetical protein
MKTTLKIAMLVTVAALVCKQDNSALANGHSSLKATHVAATKSASKQHGKASPSSTKPGNNQHDKLAGLAPKHASLQSRPSAHVRGGVGILPAVGTGVVTGPVVIVDDETVPSVEPEDAEQSESVTQVLPGTGPVQVRRIQR